MAAFDIVDHSFLCETPYISLGTEPCTFFWSSSWSSHPQTALLISPQLSVFKCWKASRLLENTLSKQMPEINPSIPSLFSPPSLFSDDSQNVISRLLPWIPGLYIQVLNLLYVSNLIFEPEFSWTWIFLAVNKWPYPFKICMLKLTSWMWWYMEVWGLWEQISTNGIGILIERSPRDLLCSFYHMKTQ